MISDEDGVLDGPRFPHLVLEQQLARAYIGNAQGRDAIELLGQVNKLSKNLDDTDPERLELRYELARAYILTGRYEEAEAQISEVVKIYQRTLSQDHPDIPASLYYLATAYIGLHRYREAEKILVRVLEIHQKTISKTHPNCLGSQTQLAKTYINTGRYKKAEELLLTVCKLMHETIADDDTIYLHAQHQLVNAYMGLGKYLDAEPILKQVIHKNNDSSRTVGLDRPMLQRTLAKLFYLLRRYHDALQEIDRVVKLESIYPDNQSGNDTLDLRNAISQALVEGGTMLVE